MQPTTQTSATPTPRLAAIVALTLAWMGLAAQAASWKVDDNGFWSGSSNWDGGVPNAVGATAALNRTGGISADRIVTLDQNATVGTLTMNDSDAAKNSWTIAQGDAFSLTLDAAGAGPATLTVSQGTANAINVPVTVTDPLTLSVATGTKLTLGGNLSGSGKITTLAPGTVRLEGNNSSFSGGIHVNDNSVTKFEIATATALGTGTVTFGNSANGPVFTNVSGGALTIDTPIGTQNHTTNPHFAGNDMSFTNFRLSSSKTLAHVFYIDGSTTLTLPNGIAANSGSRKAGTGNLTITGASAGGLMGWEGGGTLRLGHDQALGSGTAFTAKLGTYIPTGSDRIVANQTTFGAPGQNLTFDLSNGNDLTFSHASPIISHDFNITVTGPGVLTIAGNATSTMRPDKRGTGTLILSGDNSGATSSTTAGMRLHAGTLGLAHDNALGPNTNRLDVRGGTLMAVGGARTLANPVVFSTATLTVDTPYPIIFNGAISVPNTSTFGTLVVNGGTLRINGNNTGWNTASAKTVNDGGTLIVGHANALGTHASSVITIRDGGTFGIAAGTTFLRAITFNAGSSLVGTGTLQRTGSWTLPANFTVAPGFSTSMLAINVGTGNNLTMASTTTTEIEIADLADFDILAITGNAALAGTLSITLLDGYRPLYGTTFDVITSSGSMTGTLGLGGPDGLWFSTAIVDGKTLRLTSLIPEPASGLLLGLASLLARRRRR